MEYLSLAGILLSLAIIIVGSYKQVSMVIIGPVAAVVVALTGNVNAIAAYGTNYMKGMADFVMAFMPLFLAGALFGKLLEMCGLTTSVSNALMEKFGEKHMVATLFAITLLLTLAGISVFIVIFTIYPMAIVFFRKANLPKKMLPAIILGAASCQSVLPGTPSVLNVMTTSKAGQPPFAAPITGFLVFAVLTVITLAYYYRETAKMKKRGEVFVDVEMDRKYFDAKLEGAGLPNPWLALVPIAVMLVCLNYFQWKAWASVLTGVALLVLMFWKRVYGKLVKATGDAAEDSLNIITTGAIIAYGSVVNMVPGFKLVSTLLDQVSFGNPYIFAFIAVNILAAISGSATGAVGIAYNAFKDKLFAPGVDPANMSRLLAISGMGMDSLPHNGAIVLTMKYCGVTMKEGYGYMFIVTCLYGTAVGVIPIITGMLGIR